MQKYRVHIGKRDIEFRELTLGEWANIKCGNSYLELNAQLVQRTILSPNYSELRPGEILWLGEIILSMNARFSNESMIQDTVNELLDKFEESVHVIPAVICEAFPAYTPEDVLDFDFDTLTSRLAQVSWMKNQQPGQEQFQKVLPPQQRNSASMDLGQLREQSVVVSENSLNKALREGKLKKKK